MSTRACARRRSPACAQLKELEAQLRAFDGLKDATGKTHLKGRHDEVG